MQLKSYTIIKFTHKLNSLVLPTLSKLLRLDPIKKWGAGKHVGRSIKTSSFVRSYLVFYLSQFERSKDIGM